MAHPPVRSCGGGLRKTAPLGDRELARSVEAKEGSAAYNADALFDDIGRKVRVVAGVAPAEVCRRVAKAVRKDLSLDPKERDELARRLEAMISEL